MSKFGLDPSGKTTSPNKISKFGLSKIEILESGIKLSDKDPKGFTVAETKFIDYLMKPYNEINLKQIKSIQNRVLSWK
jgi:hypothetical protein